MTGIEERNRVKSLTAKPRGVPSRVGWGVLLVVLLGALGGLGGVWPETHTLGLTLGHSPHSVPSPTINEAEARGARVLPVEAPTEYSSEVPSEVPPKASPKASPESAPDHRPTAPEATPSIVEVLNIPSLFSMRNEVAINPHATPFSLIHFSREMAARIKKVGSNKEEQARLLNDFKACVLDPSEIPVTVRALCLTYGKYLAQVNSSFQGDMEQLLERADPKVLDLLSQD